MTTRNSHRKILVKRVVGGKGWKGRCLCGVVVHGKTETATKSQLKEHIEDANL